MRFTGYRRAKETPVTECEVLQEGSKIKLNKCISDNNENVVKISEGQNQILDLNEDGFYKVCTVD